MEKEDRRRRVWSPFSTAKKPQEQPRLQILKKKPPLLIENEGPVRQKFIEVQYLRRPWTR